MRLKSRFKITLALSIISSLLLVASAAAQPENHAKAPSRKATRGPASLRMITRGPASLDAPVMGQAEQMLQNSRSLGIGRSRQVAGRGAVQFTGVCRSGMGVVANADGSSTNNCVDSPMNNSALDGNFRQVGAGVRISD